MGFKETLKRSYQVVKESAIKLGGELKHEHKRSTLENELDEMYKTLGMLRYTELTDKESLLTETKRIISEIDRIKSELTLLESKRSNKCPVCGKESRKGNDFCPYCGAKLKEE